MERVSIYIDGSNFYFLALKKLRINEIGFDFEGFAKFLVGKRKIVPMGKRFYIGAVREECGNSRDKEMLSRQTKFFTYLKKCIVQII